MIAFVGSGDADLAGIFRVFREGSKCDPYVSAALGQEYTCHPHGWGFALYDGGHLHHFRSSRPVWEEEIQLPPISGRQVYGILHSRLASNPALDSPVCSHPFIAATDREVLLLAHNGGVNPDTSSPEGIVDTEWALGVVAKAGGLEEALPLLKERTKPNSALNLIVLAIPRDQSRRPALQCLNFFKTEQEGRKAYYTMYTAEVNGGRIFFSSTFKGLGIKGLSNIQVAPFEQLFSLQAPAAD